MAAGKTHDKITVAFSPIVIIILTIVNVEFINEVENIIILTFVGLSVYIFGGYMFSGDLDIKSREYNRWGKIKFIWIPYQKFFSHRSIFTHGFILGPTVRLIYIYIIYILILAVLYSFTIINVSTIDIVNITFELIKGNDILFINIGLGIYLGSGLHTATDIIYSFLKKKFTIKIRRKKKYKRKVAWR
ncbi:metal-binding protein [Clostridium sp.]|uniref:metal-binding protein n=1 Tax=Clostridium sp. TaxID=1506 RepID=UPI003F3F8A4D